MILFDEVKMSCNQIFNNNRIQNVVFAIKPTRPRSIDYINEKKN